MNKNAKRFIGLVERNVFKRLRNLSRKTGDLSVERYTFMNAYDRGATFSDSELEQIVPQLSFAKKRKVLEHFLCSDSISVQGSFGYRFKLDHVMAHYSRDGEAEQSLEWGFLMLIFDEKSYNFDQLITKETHRGDVCHVPLDSKYGVYSSFFKEADFARYVVGFLRAGIDYRGKLTESLPGLEPDRVTLVTDSNFRNVAHIFPQKNSLYKKGIEKGMPVDEVLPRFLRFCLPDETGERKCAP